MSDQTKCDAELYIDDVLSGKIVAGDLVKKAVQRHIDDLAKQDSQFYFDREKALLVCRIFPTLFRHSIPPFVGIPFTLAPWQAFIVYCVFGWKRKEDRLRRFRKVYIEMARKNGKSTLLAGIALVMMLFDNELSAHIYSAATTRSQARIIWDAARKMIRSNPQLKNNVELFKTVIAVPKTESFFLPLSSDASTLDGLNVHGAFIDEYHKHPNAEVWDTIYGGTGARSQPITWTITTAGDSTESACYEMHTLVADTLNKLDTHEELFGFIATVDDGDSYNDESVWEKANPNLRYNANLLKQIRERSQSCSRSARSMSSFLRDCLSKWTTELHAWLKVEDWDKCKTKFTYEEMLGRPCVAGLDVADKLDFTSLCLAFPPMGEENCWRYMWKFYLPEETVQKYAEEDDPRYPEWVKSGEIISVPGKQMDLRIVRADIEQACNDFKLEMVGYDPYHTGSFATELTRDGIATMVEISQSYNGLSLASKEFEAQLVGGTLEHNCGSLMRWQINNVALLPDRKGNIRPTKPQKNSNKRKVDGVLAAVIACAVAVRNPIDTDESIQMPICI